MFGGNEGDEGLVEALGLPVGLRLAPIGGVAGDSEDEFVMAKILRGLVGITAASAGGANEGETDGVIVGFVGSVFAIGEDGGTEVAGHVGEIDPLVRWDFEFFGLSGGTLECADVPVISGHFVGGGQRENGF